MSAIKKVVATLTTDGARAVMREYEVGEHAFWFCVTPAKKHRDDIDLVLCVDGGDVEHTCITLHPDGRWTMRAGVVIDTE